MGCSNEARGYGSISYRVYWEYLRAGGVLYLGNISYRVYWEYLRAGGVLYLGNISYRDRVYWEYLRAGGVLYLGNISYRDRVYWEYLRAGGVLYLGNISHRVYWMCSAHTARIPSPLPLRLAKTGRNHLNEEFIPLLPTGTGERF